MIPLDFIPSTTPHDGPHRPGNERRPVRILGALAIAALLLVGFWSYAYQGFYWFLVYFLFFIGHPAGAFGSIAAVIFAVGWFWRWPSRLLIWHPAWRASVCLACVAVVHTGWFLWGWVTFHPLCVSDTAVRMAAMYDVSEALFDSPGRTLLGPLRPDIADDFERSLSFRWGSDAVRPADEHTVLVRPAIGLLYNADNWEAALRITDGPVPEGVYDDGCREMEIHGFVPGKRVSQHVGWGLWPWNTINEDGAFARWLRGRYR